MKHPNDWHLLETDAVLHSLAVDMYKGLSDKDVRQRRRECGANTVWHIPKTSAREVASAAIFDLATLLLIISAAAAAFFDKSTEAGALVLILIVGALLRTVTYIRANRILEDRAKEKIPTASVIRGGRVTLVSAWEIVPGDIIFLEQGDTVPADGRVVSGEDSIVSERGITENKTPVHKFETTIVTKAASGEVPCEFRSNMLFAGSLVLSGSLRMAATACGEATLISRKQGGITLPPADKLPIIEKLRIRSKTTSLVMLAFVMLLTAISLFTSETSLPDVFLGTMSMAVAAMSEFLTIIATIMIAVAVRDAAELSENGSADKSSEDVSRAIIRQPEKLEEMRDIGRVVFCGSSFFKSGRSELYAYRAKGEFVVYNRRKENDSSPVELLELALAASAGKSNGMSSGGNSADDSGFDLAVRRAVDSYSRKSGDLLTSSFALYDHKNAGEPQTLGMEISLIDRDGDICAVAAGSIDTVLGCCTSIETADGVEPLTDEIRRKIFTECAKLEFGGAQVVATAVRKSPYMQLNRVSVLTQQMTFVGFLAVAEEKEEDAARNVAYLKSAGVVPILFTDNPDADLYYCHRLGIFNKNTVRIHASQLSEDIVDSLTVDGMIVSFENVQRSYIAAAYSRAMKTVMHGRVTDTDRILQEEEDAAPITAAMGRDTWDSGVLASSDVGIAAARSEMRTVPETLSRGAAVLVHKESGRSVESGFGGLGGLGRAIKTSVRVSLNIEAAKSYLTAAQSARLVVIFAAVLFDIPLIPAVFILIWGLLFDFAAVLVMAFEKHEDIPLVRKRSARFEAVEAVAIGCVWGVILAAWVPVVRFLDGAIFTEMFGAALSLDAREELALLTGSVILSGAVLAVARMSLADRRECAKFRLHLHTAGLLFVTASAVLALILTLTDSYVIGGADCGWGAILSVVPALLCAALSEIYRSVSKFIKNKRS